MKMSIIAKINKEPVVVLSKKICGNCSRLKSLLNSMRIEFKDVVVEDYAELYEDDDFIFDEIQDLKARWSIMSYPMMFINAKFVGHYSEIQQLLMFGKFEKLLEMNDIKFEHIDAF